MGKIAVVGICGKSVFMSVDHFHEDGETLVADSTYEELGGKGFNQAIAAARMGAEVSFLAAVGDDDAAKECETVLKNDNIKPFLIQKKSKKTPFAFILKDKNGENRVSEYKDAELDVDDVLKFEEEIKNAEILLIQNEVPQAINEKAVEIAAKNNVKVVLNPAPAGKISDDIASKIYLVTPNEHESKYCDFDKLSNYIITLGKRGCCINGEVEIPGINVKAVNTTGAGDTFNGVLVACLTEKMSIESACKYAVAASGISVSREYVVRAIPYRKEVEEFILNNI